jgi:sec-independent protein translocase protein TatA
MFAGLTGWHLLIILAVILLLFGATRLPSLAKSVGQSARIFKKEMKQMDEENKDASSNTKTDGSDAGRAASVSEPTAHDKP